MSLVTDIEAIALNAIRINDWANGGPTTTTLLGVAQVSSPAKLIADKAAEIALATSYLPEHIGATPVSVQQMLHGIPVPLASFGIGGLGVIDETIKLQAAVTWAITNKRCLDFGSFTPLISSAITIVSSNGWSLIGSGAFIIQNSINTPCFIFDLSVGNIHDIKISGITCKWAIQQTALNTASNFIFINSNTVNGNTGLYNGVITDYGAYYGYGGVVLGARCSIWGMEFIRQTHMFCYGPPMHIVPNYPVGMPNNKWDFAYINPNDAIGAISTATWDSQSAFSFNNIEFNRTIGTVLSITNSHAVCGGVIRVEAAKASSTPLSSIILFNGSRGIDIAAIQLQTVDFPVINDFSSVVGRAGLEVYDSVYIGFISMLGVTTSGLGYLCYGIDNFGKINIKAVSDGTIPAGYPYGNSIFNVTVESSFGKKRTLSNLSIGFDPGDANLILLHNSADVHILNTPLTANRVVTLSAGVRNSYFKFVRTIASTGAFTLDIGGLKTLASGQWCEVMHNGTAWVLISFGSL